MSIAGSPMVEQKFELYVAKDLKFERENLQTLSNSIKPYKVCHGLVTWASVNFNKVHWRWFIIWTSSTLHINFISTSYVDLSRYSELWAVPKQGPVTSGVQWSDDPYAKLALLTRLLSPVPSCKVHFKAAAGLLSVRHAIRGTLRARTVCDAIAPEHTFKCLHFVTLRMLHFEFLPYKCYNPSSQLWNTPKSIWKGAFAKV